MNQHSRINCFGPLLENFRILFILIFIILTTRISATSLDSGPKVLENGSEASVWHELQSSWSYRFVVNFLGYLVILVPTGLIIFLVKNDFCGKGKARGS